MSETWRAKAACKGKDPSIFYPGRNDRPTEALALCRTCPVQVACLSHANREEEDLGVWGGQTAQQRWRSLELRLGRVANRAV